MAKSVIQKDKQCFICGTTYNLHLHHVWEGSRRQASERNGLTVYLCAYHHNMSDEGVHNNSKNNLNLKQECQRKYEKLHSHEEFMNIIGKNYLED